MSITSSTHRLPPLRSRSALARAARAVVVGCAVAVLAGCASMSEKECAVVDWSEQGMRDALAGYPRARMEDHREACGKSGVALDVPRYTSGWNQGIAQFCTPANALRWGREGRDYRQSCPPQQERVFLDHYRVGKAVSDAEKNLRRLRDEQNTKQRQLDGAKDDKQRRHLREELRSLDGRIHRARDELDYAEQRLHRMRKGR